MTIAVSAVRPTGTVKGAKLGRMLTEVPKPAAR